MDTVSASTDSTKTGDASDTPAGENLRVAKTATLGMLAVCMLGASHLPLAPGQPAAARQDQENVAAVRIVDPSFCQNQTWPYIDPRCLKRADADQPQPAAARADATVPPPATAQAAAAQPAPERASAPVTTASINNANAAPQAAPVPAPAPAPTNDANINHQDGVAMSPGSTGAERTVASDASSEQADFVPPPPQRHHVRHHPHFFAFGFRF